MVRMYAPLGPLTTSAASLMLLPLYPTLWTTGDLGVPAGIPDSQYVLVSNGYSHFCAGAPPASPRASAVHRFARSLVVVVLGRKNLEPVAPINFANALSADEPPR